MDWVIPTGVSAGGSSIVVINPGVLVLIDSIAVALLMLFLLAAHGSPNSVLSSVLLEEVLVTFAVWMLVLVLVQVQLLLVGQLLCEQQALHPL